MALPFVPCEKCAEVVLRYKQADGSPALNTLWFKGAATYTATMLQGLAEGVAEWWNDGTGVGDDAGLKSLTSNLVSLEDVTARDMSTQHGPVMTWTTGLPLVGAVASDAIELGLTFTTTFRTGVAGVAYRGRNFMVGIPQNAIDDPTLNLVSATLASGLDTAYGGLLTFTPSSWINSDEHVVVSRYHVVGGVLTARDAGIATPVISYGRPDLYLDFQRRRSPAHNRHRR